MFCLCSFFKWFSDTQQKESLDGIQDEVDVSPSIPLSFFCNGQDSKLGSRIKSNLRLLARLCVHISVKFQAACSHGGTRSKLLLKKLFTHNTLFAKWVINT